MERSTGMRFSRRWLKGITREWWEWNPLLKFQSQSVRSATCIWRKLVPSTEFLLREGLRFLKDLRKRYYGIAWRGDASIQIKEFDLEDFLVRVVRRVLTRGILEAWSGEVQWFSRFEKGGL